MDVDDKALAEEGNPNRAFTEILVWNKTTR
jgi:hypothetical protein